MHIRVMKTLKAALLGLTATAASLLGTGSSARADFNFNPSGGAFSPTFTVSGLAFAPGNALAVDAGQLTVGQTFQLLFQTHLNGLTGPGAPNVVPGLNSQYQITEVASLSETVSSVSTVAGVTTVNFALNPANSQIKIYYNAGAPVFNDATGTGFTAGTVIATLNPTNFVASQYQDTTAVVGTQKFDPNNPADTRTANSGGGSTTIQNNVAPGYNIAFFNPPTGTPTLTSTIVKSNVSPQFDAVPPATSFTNIIPNSLVVPNIGTNNGSGRDFQLQVSGFTQSFQTAPVPEPTSVALFGIGLAGVVAIGLRKRAQAA